MQLHSIAIHKTPAHHSRREITSFFPLPTIYCIHHHSTSLHLRQWPTFLPNLLISLHSQGIHVFHYPSNLNIPLQLLRSARLCNTVNMSNQVCISSSHLILPLHCHCYHCSDERLPPEQCTVTDLYNSVIYEHNVIAQAAGAQGPEGTGTTIFVQLWLTIVHSGPGLVPRGDDKPSCPDQPSSNRSSCPS
jgi:hypothetical protein